MDTKISKTKTQQQIQDELDFADMRKRAQEVEAEASSLRNKGHTCIGFEESFPPRLVWCGSSKCTKKRR